MRPRRKASPDTHERIKKENQSCSDHVCPQTRHRKAGVRIWEGTRLGRRLRNLRTKKLAVSPNTTLHTKYTSSVNQHSLVVLQRSRASTLPSYHPRPIPTQHTTDERNKAAPWRPPGSPGSAGVVATSVAAAAAASAAMARPAINVRRKRTSGSPPPRKISTGGRQTGRRSGPSPEEEFFRGEGDLDGDEGGPGYGYGYGYGEEEESPRSAGGAYEEWLAGERYAGCFVFGQHWAWIVTAVTGSSPCHISCTCNE